MKKIVLAIMLLAYALFSADNFTFEKVNNAQEVSSKKLKKKVNYHQSLYKIKGMK